MSVSLVNTGINTSVGAMGGMNTSVTNIGSKLNVSAYASGGINVSAGLVCKTSQGAWEYLWVEEGQLYELNGEKVMVRRK